MTSGKRHFLGSFISLGRGLLRSLLKGGLSRGLLARRLLLEFGLLLLAHMEITPVFDGITFIFGLTHAILRR